jgi:FAD dependent oxidoreductase TIGR03364
MERFDCLVIGRGIVGLAHALAAHRAGLRTAVLDREPRATGASIRNFGFVTVTGQAEGLVWRRAMRSRDMWAELAPLAGITVHQRGLAMAVRRAESEAVVEEFAAGPMGAACRLLRGADIPACFAAGTRAVLESPHELRVESRDAVPLLADWLRRAGVAFLRAAAQRIESGRAHTAQGEVAATHIVLCPGTDLMSLFPQEAASRGIGLCKLHMLRLGSPGTRLDRPVMSDLGLVRYLGYAGVWLAGLRTRLEREQPGHLADGIHLIAVQGEDGSLVVGDSHHYDDTFDPFQPDAVDARILEEFAAVFAFRPPPVLERWVGWYPSGPQPSFTAAPLPGVRLVQVTSGTGASTAFALAEETLAELLGQPPPPHAGESA